MNITKTDLEGVLILEPQVYADDRGFFIESWNKKKYEEAGLNESFVQDNHSRSNQGVLRGLHYQMEQPQGKLVRVTKGAVFDVAVDIRETSKTYLQWVGIELSEQNHKQLWIPPGFAHGFYVLSDVADFQYKCTDYYVPKYERSIRWDDPALAIEWPIIHGTTPIVSKKDLNCSLLAEL